MQRLVKIWLVLTLFFSIWSFNGSITLAADQKEASLQLSPGVSYEKKSFSLEGRNQSTNIVEIDLTNPFTELELGIPNPLNKLDSTTDWANSDSYEGHRVVGAINGSFFDMNTGLPMYLIAQNNRVYNGGVISTGDQYYVNEPTAFGVLADGSVQIDYYEMKMRVSLNGLNYPVSGLNRVRDTNELIIYTPDYNNGDTGTNQYGRELIVTTNQDLSNGVNFGDVLQGTVQSIREYGDTTSAKIPANSFVVSYNGSLWFDRLAGVKVGDPVQFSVDIDDQWKNASYILGSGPLLVKDGKVNITMNPTSSRARERAPRSAVAIDSTGTKVFFVTVDGRQPGFGEGMSISEFANYLVRLGVSSAINLDGGGSTTLAIRQNGAQNVSVANSPSDGYQRNISTILKAVSTAPTGEPTLIHSYKAQEGKLLVGSSLSVKTDYVLDQYYNPIPINSSNLTLSASNGIAAVSGQKVTGVKAGSGSITVQYGNATKKLPLEVVESIANFTINGATPIMAIGQSVQVKTNAFDQAGAPIIYDPSLIKWSVEGSIGTITKSGVFTATNGGKGSIVATYNNSSTRFNVEVVGEPFVLDTMEKLDGWSATSARGSKVSIKLAKNPLPVREGSGSIELSYDFSKGEAGTKAAYLIANPLKAILGVPKKIGVWVYANNDKHWLRGTLKDGNGQNYTIDFTEQGGVDWTGWRYVEAEVPQTIQSPVKLERIYVTEPDPSKQTAGKIYIDKIQAIYNQDHEEPMFRDTTNQFIAKTEVAYLLERGIINGYPDGTFRPGQSLTRAHAAALIARALNLDTSSPGNPVFTDVSETHEYYKEIAAVKKANIMGGKGDGTFDPQGYLTRAQMAAILTNAFKLTGDTDHEFADIEADYWAYKEIKTLYASGVTTGYTIDNTFRPSGIVNRAQYSTFIYRALTREN